MLTDSSPAAPPTMLPDANGYFGPYGGMFVPETLMSPLRELADEYDRARRDPAFQAALAALLARISPGGRRRSTFAERLTRKTRRRENLPQARGPAPHRRAQDQQRAGPDPAGATHGQAAHHRRDRRGPARRRHGHRRRRASAASASSTWVPWTCSGRRSTSHAHAVSSARRWFPVTAGRGHAEGSHQRGDARLGHQRAHDLLHPRQRARFASVPDDGAGFPPRHRRRGPPARCSRGRVACRTCSSRASAAAATPSGCFHPFLADTTATCAWSASRRAARASARRPEARGPVLRRAARRAAGHEDISCSPTRTARFN